MDNGARLDGPTRGLFTGKTDSSEICHEPREEESESSRLPEHTPTPAESPVKSADVSSLPATSTGYCSPLEDLHPSLISSSQYSIPMELFRDDNWEGDQTSPLDVSNTLEGRSELLQATTHNLEERGSSKVTEGAFTEKGTKISSSSNHKDGDEELLVGKEDSTIGKTIYPKNTMDKQDTIINTLASMNEELKKLKKLENIEKMNSELQGEIAKIQTVSEIVCTVRSDMSKYEEKWEKTCKHFDDRLSILEKQSLSQEERLAKVEKKAISQENKRELNRSSIAKELEVIQSGIDSNSKKVLEMEAFVHQSKDKWPHLGRQNQTCSGQKIHSRPNCYQR